MITITFRFYFFRRTHQGLYEAAPEAADLLEVAVHVEETVLLTQLNVRVDRNVHARPPGSVTEKSNPHLYILCNFVSLYTLYT